MTEAVLTYTDDTQETIKCNYTKTREGWLEIAVTTDKPHKRIFIPAHMLQRVTTVDDGDRNESVNDYNKSRSRSWEQ